jgi:hypothetical protein
MAIAPNGPAGNRGTKFFADKIKASSTLFPNAEEIGSKGVSDVAKGHASV